MSDENVVFYDGLAEDYHLVYHDWKASVERQGDVLARVIREMLGAGSKRILDCSCGIGTQCLGLARRGHEVLGVDRSPRSVERARAEAASAGLMIEFRVGDLRHLESVTAESFDVVLSCDNSLPHLLTEADLHQGVRSMLERLRDGGLLLASIRDYDEILENRPITTQPALSGPPGSRRVIFQIWTWQPDGRRYGLELLVMAEDGKGRWNVRSHRGSYRAVTRSELVEILENAGASGVEWHMPMESGFFQPLVTARRG
ncbi:MAG: class I SAM-dependent methyltransferase [Gemmatimonadota bacterium]|jgi:SAM-dependent methyltransferase